MHGLAVALAQKHSNEAPWDTKVSNRTEQMRHRFSLAYTQVLPRPPQDTVFPIVPIGGPGVSVQSGEKDRD